MSDRNECPTCQGTGVYQGLTDVEPCRDCHGSGWQVRFINVAPPAAELKDSDGVTLADVLQANPTARHIYDLGTRLRWSEHQTLKAIVIALARQNQNLTNQLLQRHATGTPPDVPLFSP